MASKVLPPAESSVHASLSGNSVASGGDPGSDHSDHSELDGNPATELDDYAQQELERPWLSGNSARSGLADGNPPVDLARSSATDAVFDPEALATASRLYVFEAPAVVRDHVDKNFRRTLSEPVRLCRRLIRDLAQTRW